MRDMNQVIGRHSARNGKRVLPVFCQHGISLIFGSVKDSKKNVTLLARYALLTDAGNKRTATFFRDRPLRHPRALARIRPSGNDVYAFGSASWLLPLNAEPILLLVFETPV
jgi:hypothetical protein